MAYSEGRCFDTMRAVPQQNHLLSLSSKTWQSKFFISLEIGEIIQISAGCVQINGEYD